MNPALRLRLSKRYTHRLRPERALLDSLGGALHTLLRATPKDDPFFLGHGLELLRQRLGGDLAFLVTVKAGSQETRWWTPEAAYPEPPKPIRAFCRALLDEPHRTLVMRDSTQTRFLEKDREIRARGIRAAVGAVLWNEDHVKGLVFVHYLKPHAFTRPELALLDAVAGFLGRILEVEELKSSLRNLETALDITRAVVEDTSIQDPATDLPNLRYLDIWLQAKLETARKKGNVMTVAEFYVPSPGNQIREMAEGVRAGDLVVSEGNGRFLVILQHAAKKKGHVHLERLNAQLDGAPMGATLWVPGVDDTAFTSVRRRLGMALAESRAQEGTPIVWKLS